MPYVWFLTICSIWGSSFILMKRATEGLAPATISAGRTGFGAIVLALVLWRLQRQFSLRWRDALPLTAIVLTGFAVPYTIQPWLIAKYQTSAFMGMTVAFAPLLTILFSLLILGQKPTWRQMIGVCGALVFLSILMREGWRQQISLLDLAIAISVPSAYALANIWIRQYLSHVPSTELTFACLGGALVVLLPLALLSAPPQAATPQSVSWAWLAVAVLGIIGTGLSTCLFTRLVIEQGPLFAAMVTNLVPLGAIAWGIFDSETITGTQLAAMCGVISMVAIVQYKAATGPAPEPESVDVSEPGLATPE